MYYVEFLESAPDRWMSVNLQHALRHLPDAVADRTQAIRMADAVYELGLAQRVRVTRGFGRVVEYERYRGLPATWTPERERGQRQLERMGA